MPRYRIYLTETEVVEIEAETHKVISVQGVGDRIQFINAKDHVVAEFLAGKIVGFAQKESITQSARP